MTVSATSAPVALALAHAVADDFAAAEFHLFAVDRVIVLDLDQQLGVGQPDAIARGGTVHLGVGAAIDEASSCPLAGPVPRREPMTAPRKP